MTVLLRTFVLLAIVFAHTRLVAFSASDVFITPDGTAQGACTTSPQPPSFFNNAANWGTGAAQIGPGTTVHLCGTFSAPIGANVLTARGSGTSGSPVTILFESGTAMTSPAFGTAAAAAIVLSGQSFLTVDGGANGVIQNTANGDGLGNAADSTGITALGCNNCEIRNLTIQNIYVHSQNGSTAVTQTAQRAIDFNGSNWSIHNNTIHDCGWCLFENYNNGDTNIQIFDNNISNFDHGWMLATQKTNSVTNVFFHDNQVHDTVNWDATGCPFHHDGIHTFGTTGSSMDAVYVYNNFFFGSWGSCVTGFVYIEGDTVPSNMHNFAMWNNVVLVPTGAVVNTLGWISLFSGVGGTQQFYNNTVIGPNSTDNTTCFSFNNLSSLSFQNNLISSCGDPVQINNSSFAAAAVNNNLYGPSCQNGGNCFVFNGSFKGSFAAWKAACNCDAQSVQTNTPNLAPDGSPLTGSPALTNGVNLSTLATGPLASLSSDTSKGNTRTVVSRPPAPGSWTIGAYQAAVGPLPPVNVRATVH